VHDFEKDKAKRVSAGNKLLVLSWHQVKIYKVMIDENLLILVVQLHVAFVVLPESVRVEKGL
jgi:hypothetical protein